MRETFFILGSWLAVLLVHVMWPVSWDAWGLAPNVFLILTVYHGFTRGSGWGQAMGFASGLALDALSADMFGASAILFTVVGYVSGLMQRQWDEEQPSAQAVLVLLAALFHRMGFVILQGLFSETPRHSGWIEWIVRPLCTAVFAPVVFRLLHGFARAVLGGRGWQRVEQ